MGMSGIVNSIWRRFTSTPNEPTFDSAPDVEEVDNADENSEEEEDMVEPAYDMTRDQRFRFEETATIDTESESDFATITIDTLADTLTFDVRINGFTSRHGTLDAEYITVGGYAVMLYHPIPDSDEFFTRRLYYYADEGGVGGEQHRESDIMPTSPEWSREEDYGSIKEVEGSDSHLEVYDWRENMLTTGKPTPSNGQVVLRYQDSLRSGGSRNQVDNVIDVDPLTAFVGPTLEIEYISIEDGEYALYGVGCDARYKVTVPMNKEAVPGDTEWLELDTLPSIETVDQVIWAKEPEDTWEVIGY